LKSLAVADEFEKDGSFTLGAGQTKSAVVTIPATEESLKRWVAGISTRPLDHTIRSTRFARRRFAVTNATITGFAIAAFGLSIGAALTGHARAEPKADTCSGKVVKLFGEYMLGDPPNEGICTFRKSDTAAILKICPPGSSCEIFGLVDNCKDSGECVEVTHITAVRRIRQRR
jgi:hypothetical protein